MKGSLPFRKIFPRTFLMIILLTASVFPLKAQDQYSWFFSGSMFFFPEDNGNGSDPMPILPGPGAGVSMALPFSFPLRLEIALDMYFGVYGYNFYLNRAVPRAWENRSALVWGSVLGTQGSLFFNPGKSITIRAFGGLTADLRLVLLAPDLNEALNPMNEIRRENAALTEYFWSSGRWFFPVVGAGVDFTLNKKFKLGLDIRVWIPAYKAWTNEDLPPIEGWRFGIGARITPL